MGLLTSFFLVSVLVVYAGNNPAVIVKEVNVPLMVPCLVEIPNAPDFKFSSLQETDSMFTKTKTVLADRQLHIAYEIELVAALKVCTDK